MVAAGCGQTTDQGSAAEAELADAEVVATTLEVVATDHHFTLSATTVAEGMVPVELVNDGRVAAPPAGGPPRRRPDDGRLPRRLRGR